MKKSIVRLLLMFIALVCSFTLFSCGECTHVPKSAVKENVIEATCSTEGSYDEVVYCSECEAEISRNTKTVEKLAHTVGDWVVATEPTCAVMGTRNKTCTVCNTVTEIENIEKLAHTTGDWVVDAEPTCKTEGVRHKTCIVCGSVAEIAKIEKLSHTPGNLFVVKDPTGEENGEKQRKCTVCATVIETVAIPLKGTAGLVYTYMGTYYSVTDYIGDAQLVCIPSMYNGLPVTTISADAFKSISFVTEIRISKETVNIAKGAFNDCIDIESITVDPENTVYCSINGNLYNKDASELIRYAVGKLDRSFVIPSTVTKISDFALYEGKELYSITIPASVQTIGESAFFNCYCATIYCEAESIPSAWVANWQSGCPVVRNCKSNDVADDLNIYTVSDGIRYAIRDGKASVARQASSAVTNPVIPTSVTYNGNVYTVNKIADNAFLHCDNMVSIKLPNSITEIGNSAFKECIKLKSIYLPQTVTVIGAQAFVYCQALESLIIPFVGGDQDLPDTYGLAYLFGAHDNIPETLRTVVVTKSGTSIPSGAFKECESIVNIVLPDSLVSIDSQAFYGCISLQKVIMPKELSEIGAEAFYRCSSLNGIKIPEGCSNIDSGAFGVCLSLTEIGIPASVRRIGSKAFMGCTALESVSIEEDTILEFIGEYAFSNCRVLASIRIPISVTTVEANAFFKCNRTVIYCEAQLWPDGWSDIWNATPTGYTPADNGRVDVVWNCSNNDVSMKGNVYITVDSVRYTLKDGVAKVGPQIQTIRNATILSTIEYKNVNYDVTAITEYAFFECHNLQSVTIEEGVETIERSAFNGCTALSSIKLPSSLTSIGAATFYNNQSLQYIVIPSSVQVVEKMCVGLEIVIYCEAASKPDGWSDDWNSKNGYADVSMATYHVVVWDCRNNAIAENGETYHVDVDGDLRCDICG